MKVFLCAAVAAVALYGGHASGQATVSDFDGVDDTNITLQQFEVGSGIPGPGPSIQAAGGNPGGFLQVNTPSNGYQLNYATFDQTEGGAPSASTFRFDFRIDQLDVNGGADGFSFLYYDTAIFPANGSIGGDRPFQEEDPAAAGVLGFAFDTFSNENSADPRPFGPNYSEISVYFSGALISRVDDTRLLPVPFDLKDGVFHSVTGDVDFVGGTVNLSVDGNAIFTNLAVPSLTPFEHRNGFAGRTAAASERVSIDNVSVLVPLPVPEPATVSIFALGSLALLCRGRTRRICPRAF